MRLAIGPGPHQDDARVRQPEERRGRGVVERAAAREEEEEVRMDAVMLMLMRERRERERYFYGHHRSGECPVDTFLRVELQPRQRMSLSCKREEG